MVSFAWGNFSNGRIPDSAMTSIGAGNFLRADAAAQFEVFADAFSDKFGATLFVSEGYRDYATQVALKRYWTDRGQSYKAATPGGSIHGWGLAIDIYSWVYGDTTSSAQHYWLRTEGPKYGFDWYTTGEPIDEPWHFDFVGGATITTASTETKPVEEEDTTMAERYFRRTATGTVGIFGDDFSTPDGTKRGRHEFANPDTYKAWRSALVTTNEEIVRLSGDKRGLNFIPPEDLSQIVGLDEYGWGVVCGVYGV